MFNNAVIVSLPYGGFSGFSNRKEEFYLLFKMLVNIFNPYYAFVYNNLNKQLAEEFWNDKPTYVHWINYYSNDTIQKIGEKKVKMLKEIELLSHGAFLRLFDEPLNVENQLHLEKQRQISKQLGLL